jgi:hypothetical protein
MSRRRLLIILLVATVVALGWARLGTHHTPAGQPPLTYIDPGSLATLKADFNAAANQTRIIVLLAPT